jgi:hypothetical protein
VLINFLFIKEEIRQTNVINIVNIKTSSIFEDFICPEAKNDPL